MNNFRDSTRSRTCVYCLPRSTFEATGSSVLVGHLLSHVNHAWLGQSGRFWVVYMSNWVKKYNAVEDDKGSPRWEIKQVLRRMLSCTNISFAFIKFGQVEVLCGVIIDKYPKKLRPHKELVVFAVCLILFLLGICCITQVIYLKLVEFRWNFNANWTYSLPIDCHTVVYVTPDSHIAHSQFTISNSSWNKILYTHRICFHSIFVERKPIPLCAWTRWQNNWSSSSAILEKKIKEMHI